MAAHVHAADRIDRVSDYEPCPEVDFLEKEAVSLDDMKSWDTKETIEWTDKMFGIEVSSKFEGTYTFSVLKCCFFTPIYMLQFISISN